MGNRENLSRLIFCAVLIIFGYHLVRDILQILGVQHILVWIGHREHEWCRLLLCPYVTIPAEIFNLIVAAIVLKRNRIGVLGMLVLFSVPVWIVMWFIR